MITRLTSAMWQFLPLILLRVVGAGVTGGLAVYVGRTYGAEFSGHFFLFVSLVTILSVLTRLGAEPYLTSHVAPLARTSKLAGAEFLGSTLVAVIGLLTFAAVILAAAVQLWQPLSVRLLGDVSLPLLLTCAMSVNLIWLAGAYCRSIGWANFSILIETALLYLWLFGLLELFGSSTAPPEVSDIAGGLALLLPVLLIVYIACFWSRRHAMFSATGAIAALKGVTTFGAVTVTNGVVMLFPLQILGAQGMHEEAGIYNAALRVSMFVGAFGVVVKSAIVRQEARAEPNTRGRGQDVLRSMALTTPFVGFSLVLAWQGHVMSALFGSDFSQIRSILLVMLLAQCVSVAGNVVETRTVLAKEVRNLNVSAGMTILVAVVCTPVLVEFYGLIGAAWAFALTILAGRLALVVLYLSPRRIRT